MNTESLIKDLELDQSTSSDQKDQSRLTLKEALPFYRKSEYFITGSSPIDASDQYFQIYLENELDRKNQYLEGTLKGVFFPVLNNIFGVILFIRQPQLTADVGLGYMLLLVSICTSFTLITSLSLSALCSNGRIKKGGTYFILTRSLGAPLGTSIGICFWLANSVAGGQYIIGALETYIQMGWPLFLEGEGQFFNNIRLLGFFLWIFLVSINLFGIKYVSRAGIIFLLLVLLGILMVFVGVGLTGVHPILQEPEFQRKGFTGYSFNTCSDNWSPVFKKNSFFTSMGIYFPAVTGILAGANRSGDLRNASESIPKGTLAAWGFSTLIYLALTVVYACGADRATLLREDVMVVLEIAFPHKSLMAIALIMSSMGAAIECLAGAPRNLYAMVEDGNLKFLDYFKGKFNLLLIFNSLIALAATMVADINFINPINSIFFLIPYGMLNFITLFADTLKFPNWRPTYNYFNKSICLIGFFMSVAMIILVGGYYIFLAIFIVLAIFLYIKIKIKKYEDYRNRNIFGDYFDALFLKVAKYTLNKLITSKAHVKNWIPSFLVLGEVELENTLICARGALFFVDSIKEDTCINIYGIKNEKNQIKLLNFILLAFQKKLLFYPHFQKAFIHNSYQQQQDFEEENKLIDKKENLLAEYLKENQYVFMSKCIQIDTNLKKSGVKYVLQSVGMIGLEPNTIIFAFPEDYKNSILKAKKLFDVVEQSILLNKAVIITKPDDSFLIKEELKGFIDIYSFSYEKGLMLMIPYFMKRSPVWKKCTLRLFILTLKNSIIQDEIKEKEIYEQIKIFLKRYRLFPEIEIKIILMTHNQIEGFLLQDYQKFLQEKRKSLGHKKSISEQFNSSINQKNQNFQLNSIEMSQIQNTIKQEDSKQEIQMKNQEKIPEINQEEQQIEKIEKSSQNINLSDSITDSETNSPQIQKKNSINTNFQNDKYLNQIILKNSQQSEVVLINLPPPINQDPIQYLEYLEMLSNGLKRVIFIKNESQEVITEYS